MTVWKLLAKMFGDVFEVEFTAKMEQTLDAWEREGPVGPGRGRLLRPLQERFDRRRGAARENPKASLPRSPTRSVRSVARRCQALRAERPLPRVPALSGMARTTMPIEEEARARRCHAAVPDLREPDADPLGTVREVPRVHPIPDCKGTRPSGGRALSRMRHRRAVERRT